MDKEIHYKKLLCEQDIAKRIILGMVFKFRSDMNNLLFNYELPVKIDIIVEEGLQVDEETVLSEFFSK